MAHKKDAVKAIRNTYIASTIRQQGQILHLFFFVAIDILLKNVVAVKIVLTGWRIVYFYKVRRLAQTLLNAYILFPNSGKYPLHI